MYQSVNLITILGPTACGKTSLATLLASKIDGQIISADSRQVYQKMDIGTGKDLSDYVVEGKKIPYHIIDVVPAGYKYNLYEYQRDFNAAFEKITAANDMPILCGGTGLYIEAALRGYTMLEVPTNKEIREKLENLSLQELRQILSNYKTLHNTTDTATIKRAIRAIEIADYYSKNNISPSENISKIKPIIFGIDISRLNRRERISLRLKERIENGMIEEVKSLLSSGIEADDLIYYGLEYKFLTNYVIGNLSFDDMLSSLEIAIHQFAKRQMTWFRGMEKRGFEIDWIPFEMTNDKKVEYIKNILC